MSTQIHPTALVQKGAELGEGVVVGPCAFIGPNVKIGKGTVVHQYASVEGHTELGEGNVVFAYASVGSRPQDLKYKGEPTQLVVGDRNQIREFTTLNTGTVGGGGVTRIGSENLLMAYVHVGHDSIIGNRCVFTNNVLLAGHVTIEDFAILGGMCAIHQFVRIGAGSIISANSMIARDVPPFCIGAGRGGELFGLNVIGLRRRGFSSEKRLAMKRAYRRAFRSGLSTKDAIAALRTEFAEIPEVKQIADFLEASKRGVLKDSSVRRKSKRGAPEEAEGE